MEYDILFSMGCLLAHVCISEWMAMRRHVLRVHCGNGGHRWYRRGDSGSASGKDGHNSFQHIKEGHSYCNYSETDVHRVGSYDKEAGGRRAGTSAVYRGASEVPSQPIRSFRAVAR